jgi:L-2-hydroxyglutarate oxidase LhgO
MLKIETIVVGAGVIGLAIARALAARGLQVLVLEEEASIGQGVSSRTSEVIHAVNRSEALVGSTCAAY